MRRSFLLLLLVAGCMSDEERAQKAISTEALQTLTALRVERLSSRYDSLAADPKGGHAQAMQALLDSIRADRLRIEMYGQELRKLRR